MKNSLVLNQLKLKTFTEQNALDYCLLNDINPNNIKKIYLSSNQLTDISGIRLFKNTEYLILGYNKIEDISVLKYLKYLQTLDIDSNQIKDISVIKYLADLETLHINRLELESDQIEYIKNLNNLKTLHCGNGFKDMFVLNQLNKNIKIHLF